MEIEIGDRLLSKGGDWHEVLRVDGPGHVQTTNGVWSAQHNGETKSQSVIWLFTGYSLAKVSGEEIPKLYTDRLAAFTQENILERMPPYPINGLELGDGKTEAEDVLIEKVWHGAIDEMIRVMDSLIPKRH